MNVLTSTTTLRRILLLSSLLLVLPYGARAQRNNKPIEQTVFFGLGIRTIASTDLLSTGAVSVISEGVNFSFEPKMALGLDAIIRFKLKGRFSLQTGISSIRRGYGYSMDDGAERYEDYVRLTSFQIPLTGILQVPISERGKIGLETGFVLDMLPTNAASGGENYQSLIFVRRRFNSALRATAFFSQELEKGGMIEIGGGYHRLIGRMGNFYMDFGPTADVITNRTAIQGHFFYLGATFFFP